MEVTSLPIEKQFFCTDTIDGKRFRAIREDDDTVFVYAPRKQRYGYRINNREFADRFDLPETKPRDETKAWHKRVQKALNCIQESGLWTEHIPFLKNLLQMTWEDRTEITRAYWQTAYPHNLDTPEWKAWFDKYPFLKTVCADGTTDADLNYIAETADVKLESIYFGPHLTKMYREEIRQAIENRNAYAVHHVPAGYDHSFTYEPEHHRAWYCKEYRNCGNGYYYLALDHKTAWFMEKD